MKPDRFPHPLWPGAQHVIFEAPDGDPALSEILPVDGVVDKTTIDVPRVHFMIKLEPGDLDKLRELGWFWVVFYGHVVPFDVNFPEEIEWHDISMDEETDNDRQDLGNDPGRETAPVTGARGVDAAGRSG
jgi:hypothetical protein